MLCEVKEGKRKYSNDYVFENFWLTVLGKQEKCHSLLSYHDCCEMYEGVSNVFVIDFLFYMPF